MKEDLNALRASVGALDQARLDEPFTHMRAIERRLEADPTLQSADCTLPSVPAAFEQTNAEGQELLAPRMQLMSELLAMALRVT